MPRLNLANATAVKWNGKSVSRVRLNGTDIWVEPSPTSLEHSVWNTPPVQPMAYDDSPANSWLGQQFYSSTAPALKVVGLRLYVPAASLLVGKTGKIGLMRRAASDGGIFKRGEVPGTLFSENGTETTFTTPLVVGWNAIYLSASYSMLVGDGILLGYSLNGGTHYLYAGPTALTTDAISDVGGIGFNLAPNPNDSMTMTQGGRCLFAGSWTGASWYGIDILTKLA